jgi:hypothetical protein
VDKTNAVAFAIEVGRPRPIIGALVGAIGLVGAVGVVASVGDVVDAVVVGAGAVGVGAVVAVVVGGAVAFAVFSSPLDARALAVAGVWQRPFVSCFCYYLLVNRIMRIRTVVYHQFAGILRPFD